MSERFFEWREPWVESDNAWEYQLYGSLGGVKLTRAICGRTSGRIDSYLSCLICACSHVSNLASATVLVARVSIRIVAV